MARDFNCSTGEGSDEVQEKSIACSTAAGTYIILVCMDEVHRSTGNLKSIALLGMASQGFRLAGRTQKDAGLDADARILHRI
jgi:hypothetical protein